MEQKPFNARDPLDWVTLIFLVLLMAIAVMALYKAVL